MNRAPRRIFSGVLFSLIGLAMVLPTLPVANADGELVMGIFPRRNAADTIRLFKPMAKHLEERLGRKVKLVTSKNFESFWQGVEQEKYDIVHFNQYHYIKSKKEFGYEVILKSEEFGKDTITGSIIVRTDSGIHSIADLKGKEILFGGGPKAMQSYIFASYLLRKGGLKKGDYIEKFAKNPPNAIIATYYKKAAAAGSGDVVMELPLVTKQIKTEELKFLARGDDYAHLAWAVKGELDSAIRSKIQTILASLKETPEGQAILKNAQLTGLNIATDADYDPHRRIVREVLGEVY